MSRAETGSRSSVLEEAARELEAAAHDARVAFDCVALGELDRAHTSALTARVAADAAVTALHAALLAAAPLPGPEAARAGGLRRCDGLPKPSAGQRSSRRSDPGALEQGSQEPGNHAPALGRAAYRPAGRVSSDAGQRSW